MNMKMLLQDEMNLPSIWKMNAVSRILWTWQIVIIGFIIFVHTIGVPNFGTDVALGTAALVTGVCIRLNKKGHTRLAVWASCIIYWLGILIAVYTGGALDVSGWMLFMPLILMISVFINARVGIFASLMAGIYITFLAWGMNNGVVSPLGYELGLMQKYAMSITPFFLMAIEVYFITQAMEHAFKSAQEQKKVAAMYADDLELLNNDLTKSEARFRTMVESAADGIMIVDENGRIILSNPQLCDWLDYTLDELLTMSIGQINRNVKNNQEQMGQMFQILGENKSYTLNTMLHRKNGSTFPVEVRIVLIEFSDQNVLFGTVRDVTERELVQAELEGSLHEKELLLREIHHRVKNNLQIVTSMLRMQARQSTDPAAIDANRALQSRVRSMAIIHQQLYQTTNLSNINFANYIRTLVNDIKLIHNNDLIQFEFELDDVNLTVDDALTAGLLVNELVTNAIKHAFPDGQSGVVRCKLQVESPLVVIVICDSGRGGVTSEQLATSRTMGMQLLRLLTHQIKGKLEVQNHGGTRFILTFEDRNTSSYDYTNDVPWKKRHSQKQTLN